MLNEPQLSFFWFLTELVERSVAYGRLGAGKALVISKAFKSAACDQAEQVCVNFLFDCPSAGQSIRVHFAKTALPLLSVEDLRSVGWEFKSQHDSEWKTDGIKAVLDDALSVSGEEYCEVRRRLVGPEYFGSVYSVELGNTEDDVKGEPSRFVFQDDGMPLLAYLKS